MFSSASFFFLYSSIRSLLDLHSELKQKIHGRLLAFRLINKGNPQCSHFFKPSDSFESVTFLIVLFGGKEKVVLIEAKNRTTKNVIIRQLYYPYRQWQEHTKKKVYTLFFEKTGENVYSIWEFEFTDPKDYNSIRLVKSGKYQIN